MLQSLSITLRNGSAATQKSSYVYPMFKMCLWSAENYWLKRLFQLQWAGSLINCHWVIVQTLFLRALGRLEKADGQPPRRIRCGHGNARFLFSTANLFSAETRQVYTTKDLKQTSRYFFPRRQRWFGDTRRASGECPSLPCTIFCQRKNYIFQTPEFHTPK